MAYVFLKAFAETRNLRHWEAKSDQLTRSDKNHSQTQVTQSHFLTLSDVWHKMAYDFLKAFVKTRNLRRWKAKSERESYWIGFALSGYVVTSKVHSAVGPDRGYRGVFHFRTKVWLSAVVCFILKDFVSCLHEIIIKIYIHNLHFVSPLRKI